MNLRRVRNPTLLLALMTAAAHGSPVGLPRVAAAATAPAAEKPPAVTPEAGSYAVGLMLGNQLEHNGLAPILSYDALIRGIKDAIGGRAPTPDERATAMRFSHDARESLADQNRAAGRAFLDSNAKQPGVKTMPSGLQYRVLAEGDPKGVPPTPMDQVTVRYTAALSDGTVFDRSDTHDQPASFRVNSVFKGWQEAFLAMKPGAKWQLFVPPELGYGANPPPMVPPGALLVYELELLQVEPAAKVDPANLKRRPPAGAGTPPAAAPPSAAPGTPR